MGRICPILNHPIKDGVLVEDEALVKFIQKRNLDFLPNELVCRWCKHEVTKLYNKKLKKAIELHKSRVDNGSISSLKTSKSASSSSQSVHEEVEQNGKSIRNGPSFQQMNGSRTNSIVQDNHSVNSSKVINIPTVNIVSVKETSVLLSTSMSNKHSTLQENQNKQMTIPTENGNKSNVTIPKKRINDYFTSKVDTQTATTSIAPQISTIEQNSANIPVSMNQITSHETDANVDNEDVIRRFSQQPTTSNASKTNKRRLLVVDDSEDEDDEYLGFNGSRLPHIQPFPPKRKPPQDRQNILARDIMNEYIKDITGG